MKRLALVSALLGCGAARGTADDGPGRADDGGSPEAAPEIDVTGRWAMFAFEDPVAIDVVQKGNVITGTGCYGGLPTPDNPDPIQTASCVALRGSVDGRHVQFTLASALAPYAADVHASADGTRMAGRFHDTGDWTAAFAWLRIGPNDAWLPRPATTALNEAIDARGGVFELQPMGAAPAAVEVFGKGFVLNLAAQGRGPQLAGTLGSFWTTEMTWNAAEQTLVAGPAPVTSPAVPTRLALHFQGTTLVTCEATMPAGEIYRFTATRRTP